MSELTEEHYKNYLKLFEMQLDDILKQMALPADLLSEKFTEALMILYDINDKKNYDDINNKVRDLLMLLQECIGSMQFVDAKYQRIQNVSNAIKELSSMNVLTVHDSNKAKWRQYDSSVRDGYKMSHERDIYHEFANIKKWNAVSK